jgi:hypothetical protein
VIESLSGFSLDGAVLVTTPQGVAVNDVRKEHSFCVKLGIPVIGIVENMSGYLCRCGTVTHIFQSGGGPQLAADLHCPLLASIPIDPGLASHIPAAARPPCHARFITIVSSALLSQAITVLASRPKTLQARSRCDFPRHNLFFGFRAPDGETAHAIQFFMNFTDKLHSGRGVRVRVRCCVHVLWLEAS